MASVPQHAPTAPAIVVQSVSKTFRIWASPAQRLIAPALHRTGSALAGIAPRLSQRLHAAARRRLHVHEALHDISFTLQRGQALGIIGLNGSGKSTLLQIIAGVLPATSGSVQTRGRVAALLELGSGFNPELTGRENIYINGAILGLSTARIDALLGEIIAFADIGDYIEQPVKTYSSGMAVRLAFSVQVHIDPDVLIVDEALAVGDAAFQAKAMSRIQDILARGTSLLFVGHDLNAVRTFCQHALLLEAGHMVLLGAPQDVIEEYLFRVHAKTQAQALGQPPPIRTAEGFHSEDGAVLALHFADGAQHLALGFDAPFVVCAVLAVDPALRDAACIVDILDEHGVPLSGRRIRLPERATGQPRLQLRVGFRAQLAQGIYRIRARLVQAPDLHQHHRRVLCRHEADLSFEVIDNSIERFNGLFPLPADIQITAPPDDAQPDA
ncbi:MAG: ATP-binding cassette domain-containing protein [Xanthomonadaceae bacterium]|nr:ATP-binding cassette domain-containing protein [Xanthomonadaceae bacterium]